MFRGRTMAADGLAVWLFTPGENSGVDWQAYCEAIREGTRDTAWHPCPCAFQVIEAGSADPNAKFRREIADAMKSTRAGSHVLLVTRSSMVRHALTAIHWLNSPEYTLHVLASEPQALEHLEGIRAGAAAKVRGVLAELRRP